MPPGRDTPHQYKPPVGHHYGHPPPEREHHHHRYRFPPPLSHITQRDMANFHHTTPTMENATVPQGPGPPQLQQAPGSYHGSQSCPSSGYPALSETHYYPSQVLTRALRSAIEHTLIGGTNAGPYHPTGPTSTHNPVYPPGHTVPTGHSAPPGHGDTLDVDQGMAFPHMSLNPIPIHMVPKSSDDILSPKEMLSLGYPKLVDKDLEDRVHHISTAAGEYISPPTSSLKAHLLPTAKDLCPGIGLNDNFLGIDVNGNYLEVDINVEFIGNDVNGNLLGDNPNDNIPPDKPLNWPGLFLMAKEQPQ